MAAGRLLARVLAVLDGSAVDAVVAVWLSSCCGVVLTLLRPANLSCPAMSQSCTLSSAPPALTRLSAKSTPMVVWYSLLNLLRAKRLITLVLPDKHNSTTHSGQSTLVARLWDVWQAGGSWTCCDVAHHQHLRDAAAGDCNRTRGAGRLTNTTQHNTHSIS